jgi:hypothetical protein
VWGEKDGSAGSVWGMLDARRAGEGSEEEGAKAAAAEGNGGMSFFLYVFFARVSMLIVRVQCKRVFGIAWECTAGFCCCAVQIIVLSTFVNRQFCKFCWQVHVYVRTHMHTRDISGMSTPASVATTCIQPSPLVNPV